MAYSEDGNDMASSLMASETELPPEGFAIDADEESAQVLKLNKRGSGKCQLHPIADLKWFLQNNMVTKIWRQVGWRFVFVVRFYSVPFYSKK